VSTADTGALAVAPHLGDDLSKRIARRVVGEEIGGKRILGADGLSYPIGADRPLIDAARSPVIVGAGFPELLLQEGQGLRPEVEPVAKGIRLLGVSLSSLATEEAEREPEFSLPV
jgi:hypothetical protein